MAISTNVLKADLRESLEKLKSDFFDEIQNKTQYHIGGIQKMVKALILSALIGGMSPYLPFWRFDSASQPVAVAIAMFILSFVVIYPDEIKRTGGRER